MSNYKLYERVLSAINEDEGTFNAAARNWIEGADDAPFEDNEAKELFSTAKIACAAWRNKAINGRVSKIRMIECVRKIVEKNLPNPYPVEKREYGIDPEKVKITDDPEAIKGSTVKEHDAIEPNKEQVHVFGVVPEREEKPKFFNKRKNR